MPEQLESLEPEQQEQENTPAVNSTSDSGGTLEAAIEPTEQPRGAVIVPSNDTSTQPPDLDTLLVELSQSYDDEIRRIDKATAQVERQKDKILREAGGLPELEPFLRVTERASDDLMVAGKREEAEHKLAEGEQMKAEHKRLEDAFNDCIQQKADLAGDYRRAARTVLDEWMPKVLPLIRAQERKLFAMLDRVEAEVEEFIELTGNVQVFGRPGGIDPTDYTCSLVASDGAECEGRHKWFTIKEQVFINRR